MVKVVNDTIGQILFVYNVKPYAKMFTEVKRNNVRITVGSFPRITFATVTNTDASNTPAQ